MAVLGLVLKRLGWRTTMILGVLGHVVRFGIYSIGNQDLLWLVILSNVVHGFAYAFFFATVYIYVDENFPHGRPHQCPEPVQSADPGLGPALEQFPLGPAGRSTSRRPTASIDYHQLFLVPLGLGLLAAAILAIFFHPKAKDPVPEEVPVLVT